MGQNGFFVMLLSFQLVNCHCFLVAYAHAVRAYFYCSIVIPCQSFQNFL